MKYYLICGSYNWADECDVHFYEIINEEDYLIYTTMKHKFGKWIDSYYFGTNEGWDDDFNYLNWEPIELTEEQYNVIKNLPITGEKIFERLYEDIWNKLDEENLIGENEDFNAFPIKKKLELIKKYADMCNE